LSARRKPRPPAAGRPVPTPPPAPREPEAAPRESRSEQRAAAVRADLEPLAPGELPAALAASIAIAALLGLGNLIAYAAGVKISGRHPGPGILSFSAVMGIAVWGLVRRRYWAVLGFQALVALTVLYFCLLLIVASNVEALIVCLLVIGCGSWLFWKLVRVMARIQVPPTSTSP
jgi:hypothetical protein